MSTGARTPAPTSITYRLAPDTPLSLTAATAYEYGRGGASEPGERSGRLGERLYTYMGSTETFRAAGFHDVTPPGRTRLVLRYVVDSG